MDTKRILLAVADPQALVEITQALGHGWEPTSVPSEADALAQLEQRSFDALLVDFNLGPSDGSQLMNQAFEQHPELPRFLLACEADLALVAAFVSGPHEILPKPLEPASLKSRIESVVAPEDANRKPGAADSAPGATAAPVVPAVYAELLQALELPGTTNSEVGQIIGRDPALTAEVLRLTNSAYLGLPGNISNPAEAVDALGLETVKALVMALRFLAEHSHVKPAYLSIERIWQHSVHVAQLARDLVLFETKDRVLAAEALVAGLVHDLGKLVLASNFDDLYGRVHSLARKQPVALWEIEQEMFGANHGEIGACLVGMWNLAPSAVQAAAYHHEPPLGEHQRLTPLAAVHIANVLEHERRPTDEFRIAPVTSPAFLNEIGLLQRMPVWRAVFVSRRPTGVPTEAEPAEAAQPELASEAFAEAPRSRTGNDLPVLLPPIGEGARWKAPLFHTRGWVYACAAAVALGFLAFWLNAPTEQPVRALSGAPRPEATPVVVAQVPVPELALRVVEEDLPDMPVWEEEPDTDADLTTGLKPQWPEPEPAMEDAPLVAAVTEPPPAPEPALPEPKPAVAAPAPVAAASAPPPAPAPPVKKQPDYRLNGVIYTVARPAAIVNGKTVFVGDWVGGATVVSIERTQVTLKVDGQRKILAVR